MRTSRVLTIRSKEWGTRRGAPPGCLLRRAGPGWHRPLPPPGLSWPEAGATSELKTAGRPQDHLLDDPNGSRWSTGVFGLPVANGPNTTLKDRPSRRSGYGIPGWLPRRRLVGPSSRRRRRHGAVDLD